MINRPLHLLAACLICLFAPLSAQQEVEEVEEIETVESVSAGRAGGFESENWARIERGINIPGPLTMRKNSMLFLVEHRTRQDAGEESFHDLAGFDAGGLKVGLGLRYAPAERLEVGFYRLNGQTEIFDTYEFDLKYGLLTGEAHGLDMSARAGVTWFSQPDMEDAAGFFAQLIGGKRLGRHVRLNSGVLLHTESSSARKSVVDDEYSVAVPVGLQVRISDRFAWETEVVTPVAGFTAPHPVTSTSLKIITWRHTFSLVVSNHQHMGADGMVAGSHRTLGDAVIGFLITREFGL